MLLDGGHPLARFGDGTAGTDPAAWRLYMITPAGQSHLVKAAELSFFKVFDLLQSGLRDCDTGGKRMVIRVRRIEP